MSVGAIYLLCFLIGLGYAIFVGLAGHLFGGHDISGHMDVGTDLPMSPLSPTVLSTFLTGFGGGGMLAHNYFGLTIGKEVLVALSTGAFLSGGTFAALAVLFRNTQAGSEFALNDLKGKIVQVITPIPEKGLGEVALIVKGTRINGPARAVDGKPIARDAAVEVVRVVGNVYHVRVAKE
jgi:membrane-bound ClpP family serine protease